MDTSALLFISRCEDCQYATKYCHSLKLHLRKYGHKPAMVLNPDGTPNPLPIVDVYGTRRGPKIKRDDSASFPVLPAHILAQIQKTNLQNPHRQIPPQQVVGTLASGGEEQLNLSLEEQMEDGSMDSHGGGADDEDAEPPASVKTEEEDKNGGKDDHAPQRQHQQQEQEQQQRPPAAPARPPPPAQDGSLFKCSLCDFHTSNRDIFDNHVNLHDSKTDTPSPATQHSNITEEEEEEEDDDDVGEAGRQVTVDEDDDDGKKEGARHKEIPHGSSNSSALDYIQYLQRMAPLLQHQAKPPPPHHLHHHHHDRGSSAGTGSASSQSPDLAEQMSSSSVPSAPSPSSELLQRWYLEHIVMKRYHQSERSATTASTAATIVRKREHEDDDEEEEAEGEANRNGTNSSVLDLSSQVLGERHEVI